MGGEEVRWKTVRTYGKILATPLTAHGNGKLAFALVVLFFAADKTQPFPNSCPFLHLGFSLFMSLSHYVFFICHS